MRIEELRDDYVDGTPAPAAPPKPRRMPLSIQKGAPYLLVYKDLQGERDGVDVEFWTETTGRPKTLLRYAYCAFIQMARQLGMTRQQALDWLARNWEHEARRLAHEGG